MKAGYTSAFINFIKICGLDRDCESKKAEQIYEDKSQKVEVKEEEKTDEDNVKQIITEEEQETGGIKYMSNEKYLRTLMLLGVAILFLPFVVAAEAVNPVYTWWLCKISSQTAFTNITFWRKIGSNRLFTSGIFLLLIIRAVVTVAGVGRSARIIHNQLLDNVMNNPSSFFDTTSLDRILNCFTGDIPQVARFLFLFCTPTFSFSSRHSLGTSGDWNRLLFREVELESKMTSFGGSRAMTADETKQRGRVVIE
ncbi:Multidrug resistance-associated protein [Blattamonas nauphoetae]|uniref:Multidrug resistance-associated protein n=1 Tax=Blattamonas nauphoetae TaxID=2049346 RepID=A0ABQ9X3V2_9EUKA|nr:Multidrug resistance-associated protein [Blattamonas nauphoetae]